MTQIFGRKDLPHLGVPMRYAHPLTVILLGPLLVQASCRQRTHSRNADVRQRKPNLATFIANDAQIDATQLPIERVTASVFLDPTNRFTDTKDEIRAALDDFCDTANTGPTPKDLAIDPIGIWDGTTYKLLEATDHCRRESSGVGCNSREACQWDGATCGVRCLSLSDELACNTNPDCAWDNNRCDNDCTAYTDETTCNEDDCKWDLQTCTRQNVLDWIRSGEAGTPGKDYFSCFKRVFFGTFHPTHREGDFAHECVDSTYTSISSCNADPQCRWNTQYNKCGPDNQYTVWISQLEYITASANRARALSQLLGTWLETNPLPSQPNKTQFGWYLGQEYTLHQLLNEPDCNDGLGRGDALASVLSAVWGEFKAVATASPNDQIPENADVLWSPSLSRHYSEISSLQINNLVSCLNDIADKLPETGNKLLHSQDFLGQGTKYEPVNNGYRFPTFPYDPSCNALSFAECVDTGGHHCKWESWCKPKNLTRTCATHSKPLFDAITNRLGPSPKWNFALNLEMFAQQSGGGTILGGLGPEFLARAECYQQKRIQTGVSFALSTWHEAFRDTSQVQYTTGFLDVAAGDPFASSIAWAHKTGVTHGCRKHPRLFCPLQGVKREELAHLILGELNLSQSHEPHAEQHPSQM